MPNITQKFFQKALVIPRKPCLCTGPDNPQPIVSMFSIYLFIARVLIVLRALTHFGLWPRVIHRFISIPANFSCHVINKSLTTKGSITQIMRINLTNPVKYVLHKYNMDNLRNSLDMWFSNLVPNFVLDKTIRFACGIFATHRNINICKYSDLIIKHSFISGRQYLNPTCAILPPFPLPNDYAIARNVRFQYFHAFPPTFYP
jgi:hypothetical protein